MGISGKRNLGLYLVAIAFFIALASFGGKNLSSLKVEKTGKVLGDATWYDFDWRKRTSITIDDTKVAADLTDFPVLISSTNADWKSIANGGFVAQDDGGDIVFTSSDNATKLSHEIEKYDPATGELIAWVKVPALADLTDTVINLYYGNASVADQWDIAGVWGAQATGVWHMKDLTTASIADSGSNAYTGAKSAANSPAEADGKIGKSQNFSGSNNITFGTGGSITDSFTLSFWINPNNVAWGGWGKLLGRTASYHQYYIFTISGGNGRMRGGFYDSSNADRLVDSTVPLVNGQWAHATLIFNNDTNTLTWYINGQQAGQSVNITTVPTSGVQTLSVGNGLAGGGLMDEVRVTSAARSAQWVTTEYNNQNDPSTFYALGETEDGDTTPPTNPTSTVGKNQSGGDITLTSDSWYSYASPHFEWSGAADNESGLEGYWVYYGTDETADPVTEGIFQADPDDDYVGAGMVAGSTYYLRVVTENNAVTNNLSSAITLFTYSYDPTSPSAPEYVNVSPVGCSTQSSFTFTWPAGTDTGGSQIAGYDYKRGSTGVLQQTTELTTPASSYQEGDNVFYVRTRDGAGNVSSWQTAIYCSTASVQVADGPTVETGPSSMTVSWASNKNTTSYVRVYEGNDYVSEQGQTSYALTHSVKVVGLEPEKSYRYRLVWTDQSGNLGESDWYTTATSTAPQINDLKVDLLGPTSANVSWKDSISAYNVIQFGEGNYSTTIDTSGMATTGSYKLENLVSGKTYQLRINATSDDGTKFFAGTSFTMPPLPEISSVGYEMKTSDSSIGATVSWKTNVETTSSLFYGPKGGSMKEVATTEKKKDHTFTISGLSDSSTYDFYVAGTDVFGNSSKSSTLSFSTPADRRPPTISDIITETSNVGLNKQDKAQIIVSWKTDEPATSYVEYDTGLSGSEYKQKTAEDKNMTNSHLVIISDLNPAQPYHLRVVSLDKGGNPATSEDIAIIAGDVPKSVFNIITNTFENIFGWLGKII